MTSFRHVQILMIACVCAGTGCVDMTSEARDVCITRTGIEFSIDELPGDLGSATGRRAWDGSVDELPWQTIEKIVVFDDFEDIEYLIDISRDSALTFKSIELQASEMSAQAVSFEELRVSVKSSDTQSFWPEIELLRCSPEHCSMEEGVFHGQSGRRVDALPYLRTGGLAFRFVLTLPAPTPWQRPVPPTPWRGDVEICMDATVHARASL